MIASKQIAENYVETGRKKAELPVSHMLILGFFAGMFIALAGAGAGGGSAPCRSLACTGVNAFGSERWRFRRAGAAPPRRIP
jgi:formate/nitrite transporter FocA (FNT family)